MFVLITAPARRYFKTKLTWTCKPLLSYTLQMHSKSDSSAFHRPFHPTRLHFNVQLRDHHQERIRDLNTSSGLKHPQYTTMTYALYDRSNICSGLLNRRVNNFRQTCIYSLPDFQLDMVVFLESNTTNIAQIRSGFVVPTYLAMSVDIS